MSQPVPPPGVSATPFYRRQTQDWAIVQERQRHIQALYSLGEETVFLMMWKVEDHEQGLVERCPTCQVPAANDAAARAAAVYRQADKADCPDCWGTTFAGGVRATTVRPAILNDSDEDERKGNRGVTHGEQTRIETTDDFRVRTGDYAVRSDGTRWQLGRPQGIRIRTGYAQPTQAEASVGMTMAASLQDRALPVYKIPLVIDDTDLLPPGRP